MGIGDRKEVGNVKTEDSKLSLLSVKSLLKKVGVSWAPEAPLGVEDGGVEETTSASNCSSWPMKLKLGETIARCCRMMSKACSNRNRWVFMMYAMQIVGEREIPASQWTSTLPPSAFTRSVERRAHGFIIKCFSGNKWAYESLKIPTVEKNESNGLAVKWCCYIRAVRENIIIWFFHSSPRALYLVHYRSANSFPPDSCYHNEIFISTRDS